MRSASPACRWSRRRASRPATRDRQLRRLHADPGHGRHPDRAWRTSPGCRASASAFTRTTSAAASACATSSIRSTSRSCSPRSARPAGQMGRHALRRRMVSDHHGRAARPDRRARARRRRHASSASSRVAGQHGRLLLECRPAHQHGRRAAHAWRPTSTACPRIYGHHRLVLTNTTPTTAYRGAGRPNVAYLVGAAGRRGRARHRHRPHRDAPAQSDRRRSAFPYKTPTGSTYDSGDPAGLLDDGARRPPTGSGFAARRARSQGARQAARHRLRAVHRAVGLGRRRRRSRSPSTRDGDAALYSLAGPSGPGLRDRLSRHRRRDPRPRRRQDRRCAAAIRAGPTLTGTGSFGSRSLISHGAALYQRRARGRRARAGSSPPSSSRSPPPTSMFANGRYRRQGHRSLDRPCTTSPASTPATGRIRSTPPTKLDVVGRVSRAARTSPRSRSIPTPARIEIVRYVAVDDCGIDLQSQDRRGPVARRPDAGHRPGAAASTASTTPTAASC